MTPCSGCMLSRPCRATPGQSLLACHPVQPSWHLPPGVLAAYAGKQGGFSWQAWAPAWLQEPHPASPSRWVEGGGGGLELRKMYWGSRAQQTQGPSWGTS